MSVHMSITASREAKHATRGDYASGALDTAASFVGIGGAPNPQGPSDQTQLSLYQGISAKLAASLGSENDDDDDDDDDVTQNSGNRHVATQPSVAAPQQAQSPQSTVTWNGGTLSQTEVQIVSVLDRHKDQCPLSWDGLQDKINDPSTPPDLKAALQGLAQDQRLFIAIGSQGDGRCGGKIKAKDLDAFTAEHAQVSAFNEQQAKSFEQNYIPSDGNTNGQPSVMTESDALRELYKYSDNLTKNLGKDEFQQIVDGDAKTGKTPPQVIAAAQYFLDHQDSWNRLTGGGEVKKADFLQAASSSMSLTQSELNTLKTMNGNQDAFFGDGDLTRDKLASMANNKQLDPNVREAATHLLQDPVMFSLLNNAITGYKTHHGFFDFGGGHTVDSGNIAGRDFQKFYGNLSQANQTVQKPQTHTPKTDADKNAVACMLMGTADQPEIKSPKHNGGFLMHAIDEALKVEGKLLDWASMAVGALSFIPGVGELADAASTALEAESQGCNILHAMVSGGNVKKALEEAGLNLAAAAIGNIGGPEVRLAMKEGITKIVAEKAINAGINLSVSQAQGYAENYLAGLQGRLEADPSKSTDGQGDSQQVGTDYSVSNVIGMDLPAQSRDETTDEVV
ncbi:HrpF/NolX family T3SS translocon protein [Ralstonia pseudosolanacearum]|uniref:HrpF/NolX family T3SS translocon protein n=1 Tax=Ralstonia pseudosolanacearum TaxID=1310165 RepID=UPI0002C07D88|nr:HrpF/NolX family T3SS translocon protein [Ralstonia pseudosolanacearum]ANH36379.1 Type III secretion translocator of effector proteins (HrpF, NolX) [Ralstonia solanacearum]ESS49774.1 secreted protein popf2 [Ralstonia solanacearum SD54]AGH86523.1 Type III secretion translocator of effector proteins (HrpF, NolX) [Ralstonia pseudosolanacearum FQY_4]MCK4150511.1 nodulation protein NOLX [Ralstonia pseudosolanacearum]BCL89957.1 nodulation outer protein X [Ralstonia solanacearum]